MDKPASLAPGLYYHYKHDPQGAINNYAYRVLGLGHHTEDDCRPEDQFMMVYRPLYPALVYRLGKLFDLRPAAMTMETVEYKGSTVPRFQKITDATTIAELERIEKEMYD